MIACLYDVHGNLPALEAVLADARAQGAERFLLGGDYALYGGWPVETLERLRAIDDAIWLRGNADRWLADPGGAPEDPEVRAAIADCRAALGEAVAGELIELPEAARVGEALAVHASPRSDMQSFLPEPEEDEIELLSAVQERRLIFGHTHLAFRRTAHGIDLVNPGSVGIPLDGDVRAAYALLHPGGDVEHRRVDYDQPAAIARLREAFGDAAWVTTARRRLEQASFDAS